MNPDLPKVTLKGDSLKRKKKEYLHRGRTLPNVVTKTPVATLNFSLGTLHKLSPTL